MLHCGGRADDASTHVCGVVGRVCPTPRAAFLANSYRDSGVVATSASGGSLIRLTLLSWGSLEVVTPLELFFLIFPRSTATWLLRVGMLLSGWGEALGTESSGQSGMKGGAGGKLVLSIGKLH